MMNSLLFELVVVCMLGVLHARANTQPKQMGEEEQQVGRRYAESTIASEISKIMDSMVQKNFVHFLLSQKDKKCKPATVSNDLLKLRLHQEQKLRAPKKGAVMPWKITFMKADPLIYVL